MEIHLQMPHPSIKADEIIHSLARLEQNTESIAMQNNKSHVMIKQINADLRCIRDIKTRLQMCIESRSDKQRPNTLGNRYIVTEPNSLSISNFYALSWDQQIHSLAYSPDGSLLALCGPKNLSLYTQKLETSKGTWSLPFDTSDAKVKSLSFSFDSSLIAFVYNNRTIAVFSIQSSSFVSQISLEEDISTLDFSLSSSYLYCGLEGGKVIQFDNPENLSIHTSVLLNNATSPAVSIYSIAITGNPTLIIICRRNGKIDICYSSLSFCLPTFDGIYPSDITCSSIRIDKKFVFLGSSDGSLHALEFGLIVLPKWHIKPHTSQVTGISVSPYNDIIMSISQDGDLQIREFGSDKEINILRPHSNKIEHIKQHPSRHMFVTSGADRSLLLWDYNPD